MRQNQGHYFQTLFFWMRSYEGPHELATCGSCDPGLIWVPHSAQPPSNFHRPLPESVTPPGYELQ